MSKTTNKPSERYKPTQRKRPGRHSKRPSKTRQTFFSGSGK